MSEDLKDKMKKIYFIGGGDLVKGELKKIDQEYIKEYKKSPLFVLDLTTNNLEKTRRYREFLRKYFIGLGAKEVRFFSELKNEDHISLNNYGILYIPGGDPLILLKNLDRYNLKSKIRNFKGVIVGNSAGALVLCKNVLITKDKDNPETKILNGIGLVDFSVEVHYDPKTSTELELFREKFKIYAISEGSCLIYHNGHMESKGKVVEFAGQ